MFFKIYLFCFLIIITSNLITHKTCCSSLTNNDNSYEIHMGHSSAPSSPQQLLEEYTKQTLSPINTPHTSVGRTSLVVYSSCIECMAPWSRLTIFPFVALGMMCGTTSAVINILTATNVFTDTVTANGIAAGLTIAALIIKSLLILNYYMVDSLNSEAKMAGAALQAQTGQIVNLLETTQSNLNNKTQEATQAIIKTTQLTQVANDKQEALKKETIKRMTTQGQEPYLIDKKVEKISDAHTQQLNSILSS